MNKKILALALGAGALLAVPAAFAADGTGFFVDGRIGSASVDEDDFDDDSSAFQINGGYRWGGWGVEAGYVSFSEFEGEDGDFELEADIDGFTLGVNGRSNFASNWYLSGRLGAFFWEADADAVVPGPNNTLIQVSADEDGTDLYAGVGVGYDFSDQWSVGLAYDYFGPERNDVSLSTNVLSLTTELRF